MGLGLEALARIGGHAALGFASIEAYALERCDRSATWTRVSRRLAIRAQGLPQLRGALISGQTSWSMGVEIAKVATPEDEAHWLLISGRCTVARFRALVKELRGSDGDGTTEEEGQELCTLTVTANREETWLWECAKMLFRHIEGGTTSDLVECVVAEATSSLMGLVPKDAADPNDLAPSYDAQNAWNRQLAKYREEAERLCDGRLLSRKDTGIGANDHEVPDFTGSPESIDRILRQISGELAARDVVVGELAERFWSANGWRRLGYATEAQYARERLGAGTTFINDRRQLACRLSRLPYVKRALEEGHIGYEAARVVAGVAAPATDAAWAERARGRTLVQLGEDVRVAELVSRVELRAVVEPPSDELVAEARALETAVVTGALFRENAAPPTLGRKFAGDTTTRNDTKDATSRKSDDSSLWTSFTEARRAPSEVRSRARDVIRLRIRPEIRQMYRGVERLYLRHQPRPMSFIQFICLTFIKTWARELPAIAYAHIYARDGLRCTNPTCTRRDCTPHHVRFRAHGGGDEPENLTTLCVWCHLEGVHLGRISVTGEAPNLTWSIGEHTVVRRRERQRAA